MGQRYVVTGAYVTCKTQTPDGIRIVGLYKDAWVPEDATGAWIEHHLVNNLIKAVPGTEPPPAHPAPVKAEAEVKPEARPRAAAKTG